MSTATAKRTGKLLRKNFGSHPTVKRVFFFCEVTQQVGVLFRSSDGIESCESVSPNEIEATEDGRYIDAREELLRRADVHTTTEGRQR